MSLTFEREDGRVVGELIIKQVDYDDPGKIEIVHADPLIAISVELLADMRRSEDPRTRLVDDVLTIDAVNRRVVYRLGEKVPWLCAYYAEWPD